MFKNLSGVKWSGIVVLVLLGTQCFYSTSVIQTGSILPPRVDAVLVYSNDPVRVPAGIHLAAEKNADYFIVSDWGLIHMDDQMALYGHPGRAKVILEGQAETTDQNARFTSRIIRQLPVRNVALVTSWFHMPRALLLTRLYLWDTPVRVYPYLADVPDRDWFWTRAFWVEEVKLWGSFLRVFLSWFTIQHWPPRKLL